MIPDPFDKKVKIPVRINNGRVQSFSGGDLPDFVGEVIGDLIVPAYSIKDPKILHALTAERVLEALPKGSYLLAEMRVRDQSPS